MLACGADLAERMVFGNLCDQGCIHASGTWDPGGELVVAVGLEKWTIEKLCQIVVEACSDRVCDTIPYEHVVVSSAVRDYDRAVFPSYPDGCVGCRVLAEGEVDLGDEVA